MSERFDIGGYPSVTGPVFTGTDLALVFSLLPAYRQDVTLWAVALSFKKNRNDNSYIVQYTSPTVLDATIGRWQFNIAKADLTLFPPGNFWYDFKRTNGGSSDVLTWGTFQVDLPTNSA